MTGAPERAEVEVSGCFKDIRPRRAAHRWRYRWLRLGSGGSVLRLDDPKGSGPRTNGHGAPPSPPFAAVGRLAAVGHAIVGWGRGHRRSIARRSQSPTPRHSTPLWPLLKPRHRASTLPLSLPVRSLHRLGGGTLAPAAPAPAALAPAAPAPAALLFLLTLTSQLQGHRMHEAGRLQPLQ